MLTEKELHLEILKVARDNPEIRRDLVELVLEQKGIKIARGEKWIQKAVKKPGALHKDLGIPEDEEIPTATLKAKQKELEEKSEGEKTLSKKELKVLHRVNMALTLRGPKVPPPKGKKAFDEGEFFEEGVIKLAFKMPEHREALLALLREE